MIQALKELETQAQNELLSVSDAASFEALKLRFLGRKGLFASVSERIKEVPNEEKRLAGQEMNRVKNALEALFAEKEGSFRASAEGPAETIDRTMPSTFTPLGNLHPLTKGTHPVPASD
jgi:phenylalanyl-tRNA synthetase alpha chain